MMPTKDEYFASPSKPPAILDVEMAEVVAFADSGEPLLRFAGDTTVSSKVYRRMRHYDNPRRGDRVVVINNIIYGTWTDAE